MDNKSSPDLGSNGNKPRAFYEAPVDRPIASSIINETRSWLNAIHTNRPFTPQTDNRSLFGVNSQRNMESRPPSSISLGPRNFDTNPAALDVSSRPSSGPRLAPLNKINLKDKIIIDNKFRSEIRRKSGAWEDPKDNHDLERHQFQNVEIKSRTNSLSNISNTIEKQVKNKQKKETQPESYWKGLPPTSPTRTKPKLKSSTSIQYLNTDKRISSGEISSRGSSAELSNRVNSPKLNQQILNTNNRPDSGSSCSSTSSTNAFRTQYKARSHSRHDRSEESETPRPRNGSGGGAGDRILSNQKINTIKDDQDMFFKDTLAPILDILSAPVEYRKKDSTEDFINLTKLLYMKLDEKNMLGKHCSYRSDILKAVFKVLDSTNPILVISASKIILSMVVRDVNLTNICKLIFKVSKNKNNDKLFEEFQMSNILIETLSNIKPDQSHTALLYLMCTLKFLSKPEKSTNLESPPNTKKSISDSLIKAGLLSEISNLLQKCIKMNESQNIVNKSFADFICQSFSCLINLESSPNIFRKYFVQNQIPLVTVVIIQQYYDNNDLIFEAFRLLSRLTQHADCCQMIETKLADFCPLCLNLMLNSQNDHLILRIAFIIGDMLTRSEEARLALFPDKSCLNSFLKVFHVYTKKFQSTDDNVDKFTGDSTEKDAASVDDIIVKLLRVIANAAIAESVGRMVASNKSCLNLLLVLINSKKILEKEELLTISISALNNISFYMVSAVNPEMKSNHLKIIEALYKIIANKNGKDHLGGIIRVLGNLSRETYMRDWIVENRLVEFLITILDSDNQDTVFFTVGVILNLMTDQNKRHLLLDFNGITRLIEVLRDFASRDWQLAGLVCQTLWNYTEIISTTTEAVLGGDQNTEELIQLLTLFTDSDEVESIHLTYYSDHNTLDYLRNSWQTDFLPVARDLISRLEQKMNRFEPL